MRCHPVLFLTFWLFFAVLLQGVSLALLAVLFALLLTFRLSLCVLALRRMRWLLLALCLVTAWSVPGAPLLASDWSPSWPGVQLACAQGLRLLVLMVTLRILWLHLGQSGFLSALAGLLLPLRWFGLPVSRLLLRLHLTLFYAEHWLQNPPVLRLSAWQQALAAPVTQDLPDEVKLGFWPWTRRDVLVLLLQLLLFGLILKAGR